MKKKISDRKDETHRKGRTNVLRASFLFGIFYWAVESLRTMLLSTEGTLVQRLLLPDPMEMWMRLLAVFVLFLFGLYVQSMLTEHEKFEAALTKRSKFERCITNISAHFISLAPEEFQSGIDETLVLMSKFAEVDHSFVYIYSNLPDLNPSVFENVGGNGLTDLFSHYQTEKWEWWDNRLKRFECITIDLENPLPKEARCETAVFSETGIQAMLVVPIVYE